MDRRSFITGLLAIPLGIGAKRLFDLFTGKAVTLVPDPSRQAVDAVSVDGTKKTSYFYIFADPNEVSEIPLPTGEVVHLYKSDLQKLLNHHQMTSCPYPLTIADGEAYQRDLQKHGKKPWRYGNV